MKESTNIAHTLMKHVFIVNKISGKHKAYNIIGLIKEVAEEKNLDYEIIATEYENHAREIAESYYNNEVTLYSVGGDGTLLEIVNGMNLQTPLGVIPAGSGNDFFRFFDGNSKRDLRKILNDTIDATPKDIDIGVCGDMKFVNTTSIGLDAIINANASRLIRNTFITKGPAYIISILENSIALRTTHVRLLVDDKEIEGDYYIIACMNGKYYGNGVMAAPSALLSDGYFDLCLFKRANRFKTYSLLMKYLRGKHEGFDGIDIIRCKHVILDTDGLVDCQSDGENYRSDHIDISIREKALKLKIPF